MRSIQIYDTTLRDGTQGEGVSLSLHDKLQITRRLDELGVDFIEGGYPLASEKDAEYFQRVRELGLKHARICAFGMTRRRGMSVDRRSGDESAGRFSSPRLHHRGQDVGFPRHASPAGVAGREPGHDRRYDSFSGRVRPPGVL